MPRLFALLLSAALLATLGSPPITTARPFTAEALPGVVVLAGEYPLRDFTGRYAGTYRVCSPEVLPTDPSGAPIVELAHGRATRPRTAGTPIPLPESTASWLIDIVVVSSVRGEHRGLPVAGRAGAPATYAARAADLIDAANRQLRLLSGGAVILDSRVLTLDDLTVEGVQAHEQGLAPSVEATVEALRARHPGRGSAAAVRLIIHPHIGGNGVPPSDVVAYLTWWREGSRRADITFPIANEPHGVPIHEQEIEAVIHEWLHAVDVVEANGLDLHDTRGYAPNHRGSWQGWYAQAIAERFDTPLRALLPTSVSGCASTGSEITFDAFEERCTPMARSGPHYGWWSFFCDRAMPAVICSQPEAFARLGCTTSPMVRLSTDYYPHPDPGTP